MYVCLCIYIYIYICIYIGFPGGASDKQSTCQCRRHKKLRFKPWVRKISWRRAWQSTPVFLPGNSVDRGDWWATVHRVPKSQMRLEQCNTHVYTHRYIHMYILICTREFPGGSVIRNPSASAGSQKTWVPSLGQEDALEKEMATHSHILTRRIPWTEEPGGLQFMGSQKSQT